ncbi:MAG TPA: transglycosylase SLT domain-containing protein [Myxococcota bacterium]|nr:transglycosylase SLT domain-containing protein [Myxococcota bacterium]
MAARLAKAALEEGEAGKDERATLNFLRVLALMRAGQGALALQALEDLSAKELPSGLASHIAWYHASLLLTNPRPGKPNREKARGLLARVPLAGRFGLQARQAQIAELLRAGEADQACSLASQTADLLVGKRAEPAARLQQAACLERLAWKIPGKQRRRQPKIYRQILSLAAGWYRLTARLWPGSAAGLKATERLSALVRAHVRPQPADPEALLARARSIIARPRGRKDLNRFMRLRSLVSYKSANSARCRIDLLFAEVAVRYRWFRTARSLLASIRSKAADSELRARAGVDLAGLLARRSTRAAIEAYIEVSRKWPEGEAASWALALCGDLARRSGQDTVAKRAYMQCIEKRPDSRAAAHSRFGLAWMSILAGEHEKALPWLDFLLASSESNMAEPPQTVESLLVGLAEELAGGDASADDQPEPEENNETDEDNDDANQLEDRPEPNQSISAALDARRFIERVRYWRARTRLILGDGKGAKADFERLAAEHPYDFYSLMARERLFALGAIQKTGKQGDREEQPSQPALESLHPEVAAAAAYLQMNLPLEARATLLSLPRTNLAPDDRRVASTLWLIMGEYSRSLWSAPVGWEGGLPGPARGATLANAKLAYPRAFYDIVKSPARDPGVPPALLFAIMRAESAFRPDARSPARALGLTQVVGRTAYSTARRIKLKGFRFWKLVQPEISIRIGSAHMAELLHNFCDQPALMLAAYNAGEPAVYRWLAKRGQLPLDAFIEEIPYQETSRYVRKVLSFYAIYHALYESPDRALGIELEIPAELVARAKRLGLLRAQARRALQPEKKKKDSADQRSLP